MQLGHSDVATTARHYARWCGGDEYAEPKRLEPGEVPADLLARVQKSPHSPPTYEGLIIGDAPSDWNYEDKWHAGRDSNPRPSGSKNGPGADEGL